MFFRLDLGQISFNLVKNAFATQQLDPLAASITFYDILARVCTEIKILDEQVTYVFFPLSFFSFSFVFAALIDLLLGLLALKKLLRKRHRGRQFLQWSSQV